MSVFKFDPLLYQQPVETSFDEQTGHLVVKLDRQACGQDERPVKLGGTRYQPKDELHITIISREAAQQLAAWLGANPGRAGEVRQLVDETDWSYRRLDRFYQVRQAEGVESLIQLVEVNGLEEFYHRLGTMVGGELEVPPAHVTLYVTGDPQGIGIPTREAFERLVQTEFKPGEVQVS